MKIYDSAQFNNMFQNSVLDSCLMSQELIDLEMVQISLILFAIWHQMQWKSRKKRENALLEKNFKVIFPSFFLLKLSLSDPLLSFYSKKTEKCSLYIFFKNIKKRFFSKNIVMSTKTFKTKKVLKIFKIFFLCSVEGVRCGSRQKFDADRRIFKHCKKSAKMRDGIPSRRR